MTRPHLPSPKSIAIAYDEKLAQRVRDQLTGQRGLTEKKMFGGLAFLLSGKMCCGVLNDDLVARVRADDHAAALKRPHTRPMDFTGRPMKGFVYVAPPALRTSRALQSWLDQSIAYVKSLPAKPAARKRSRKKP